MNGRILIVDDAASQRLVLQAQLTAAYYHVLSASDMPTALGLAQQELPDVMIVNLDILADMGPRLISAIRRRLVSQHIPIIALTSSAPDRRQLAFSVGADATLSHPVAEGLLLALVRRLMRLRREAGAIASVWGDTAYRLIGPSEGFSEGTAANFNYAGAEGFTRSKLAQLPPQTPMTSQSAEAELRLALNAQGSIALVGPKDLPLSAAGTHILQRLGKLMRRLSRDEAVKLAAKPMAERESWPHSGEEWARPPPEIFLIEANLGLEDQAHSGLRLMAQLSANPATEHSSFCVLVPPEDNVQAALALDFGAADVISTDILADEMVIRLNALLRQKRRRDHLRAALENSLKLAIFDPLTGCHNRRYALPQLRAIHDAAEENGESFALILADLDHFKGVNDTLGHSAGDQVLCKVAQILGQNLAGPDLLARIGGEEFLIVLPNCSRAKAEATTERLRQAIAQQPVMLNNGKSVAITISMGVIIGPRGDGSAPFTREETGRDEITALIDAADEALRHSKQNGRNKISFAKPCPGALSTPTPPPLTSEFGFKPSRAREG